MRQSGPAGVVPGGEPERSDVGGGIGELPNQDGSSLVVKVIVVFVGVGILSAKRISICKKNRFEPAVGPEARIKGVVGGIADERCVVGAHGEKGGVAFNQCAAETFVDSSLAAQMAVEIIGSAERVVSLRDVMSKNRRIEPRFVPFSRFHGVGQSFAVDADLPREEAVRVQFHFAEFRDRRLVTARQGFKRETAIFVQGDEITSLLSGIFRQRIERIRHVL